jgi:hypothetical protein
MASHRAWLRRYWRDGDEGFHVLEAIDANHKNKTRYLWWNRLFPWWNSRCLWWNSNMLRTALRFRWRNNKGRFCHCIGACGGTHIIYQVPEPCSCADEHSF